MFACALALAKRGSVSHLLGCAGRHPMPADLASRMTLALADAGESRLDRYPATRRCSNTVAIGSVFYAR